MINYDFGDGSNVYFTSDTHFCHESIINYCDRPFETSHEMDETMIERWNSKVGKDDIVFHLGDFCFGGPPKWNRVLDRLNGHIYLIKGNHDERNLKDNVSQRFKFVTYQMRINIDGWTVYLNHYPFLCYGGAWSPERLVVQLFGHCHSSPKNTGLDYKRLINCFPGQYDVGVDNNNFYPISWHEVKAKLEKQLYTGKNQYENSSN